MQTVLVDVDGVTADSHKTWLNFYNQDYHDWLTFDKIKSWGIHQYVKPECGRKIYDYLRRPDFYDNTLPVMGAVEGVGLLRRLGYKVVFVSAGMFPAKVDWLAREGFLVDFPYADHRPETARDVILCNDKSMIRGDYLIDDYPGNLAEFPGKRILFDQPWNEDATRDLYHFRGNWPFIMRYFVDGALW